MEFLQSAFKAIPSAATHPFALLAYLISITSWTIIAYRVQRNVKLLDQLEKLPERDRLQAMQAEMGAETVRGEFLPQIGLRTSGKLTTSGVS